MFYYGCAGPDLDMRGGGWSSRPLDKGGGGGWTGLQKRFWALRASVLSKNKGGPGPSPGSATVWFRVGGHCMVQP